MAISHVAEVGAKIINTDGQQLHRVYRMRYNEYFLSDDPLLYLMTLTSEQREVATDGTDGQTDGQKSPNDCSNPPPTYTLCGEG
jgi:phage-related minor tail protein